MLLVLLGETFVSFDRPGPVETNDPGNGADIGPIGELICGVVGPEPDWKKLLLMLLLDDRFCGINPDDLDLNDENDLFKNFGLGCLVRTAAKPVTLSSK